MCNRGLIRGVSSGIDIEWFGCKEKKSGYRFNLVKFAAEFHR